MENINKVIKKKPIISWWKSGDPCLKLDELKQKITDINIINTKHLTDDFIGFCLQNKNKVFLHVNITGMGETIFEPNIPSVKKTFTQLKKLIDLGFQQKQILVVVNPVLPNENGLKALKLLLRVFTEFKPLRLRYVRFTTLSYRKIDVGGSKTYVISNNNINKRPEIRQVMKYITNASTFFKEYNNLLRDYKSIITIDKGDEYLIGVRELITFNLKNEWIDENNERTKLITYEKNNRFKPQLNLISDKKAIRCANKCLLCPYQY